MNFPRFARLSPLLAAAAIAACGMPQAGDGRAFLRVAEDGQTINGQYDPADFSQAQMRFLLKGLCNTPRLATYGETPVDGTVAFTTTCAQGTYGTPLAGGVFTRLSPTEVKMNFTFRDTERDVLVQRIVTYALTASGGRVKDSSDVAL